MCINTLATCSYPHHDPIASIIFDPAKKDNWQICDRTQPWGRLSCGALEVHHSISYARSKATYDILLECAKKPNLVPTPVSAPSSPPNIDTTLGGIGNLDTTICQWCTTVLNMHAHKFKSVQEDAKTTVEKLEATMDEDTKLRETDMKIKDMEAKLDVLRVDAWLQRKAAMDKVES